MDDLDGRNPFLVIGDSISIGYTPFLKKLYPDNQVMHNSCNGKNSSNGAKYVTLWTDHADHFEYCTFNHGIWNLYDGWQVSMDQYLDDLTYEASVLSEKCDHVMFITATDVPKGNVYGKDNKIVNLNRQAVKRMNELGIKVCDTYTLSETITDLHLTTNDVHWQDSAYEMFANKIKECFDN
jgi:hypothetical protein